mgnify:CR=1 FL=1
MNACKNILPELDMPEQHDYELYLMSSFKAEQVADTKIMLSGLAYDKFLENSAEMPQELAEALRENLIPSDEKVQKLIHNHYESICQAWIPKRSSYTRLGQMYHQHEHFKKFFDKFEPDLAIFIAEAMHVYAEEKL